MAAVAEMTLALADRLKTLRAAAGMSQEALARAADITLGVVQRLEQGRVDEPSWRTIRRLAKVLGASLDDLASASDEEESPAPAPAKRGRPRKTS